MTIPVKCSKCQRELQAKDSFAGTRAECPDCGGTIQIPTLEEFEASKSGNPERSTSMEIVEFLDPPQLLNAPQGQTQIQPLGEVPAEPSTPVLQRMFEALLDPRAIQWMLTIGGGLTVLGLIIWLVSIGLFKNPLAVAGLLGAGSIGALLLGWWVTLKTSHKTAGRALTFLACVVAPLNLWYYQSQGLMTIDQHLWIGGLVCILLYLMTVKLLKDPLFMYAVESGVTLTVLLLAADLNFLTDIAHTSVLFVILGAISIHAERLFDEKGEYRRDNFGLPLFWTGQAQLGIGLLILLGSQCLGWLVDPLQLTWTGNLFTQSSFLAGGIWLGSAYLYLYSDLMVRRHGLYTYFAGICVLMAEVTLILPHLSQEMVIAALAVTALVIELLVETRTIKDERLRKHAGIISMITAIIPVFMGLILHYQATSRFAHWEYSTGWEFVVAMLVVTITNRIAAFLVRHTNPDLSLVHFVFSGAAAVVTAAGFLRTQGYENWYEQAPLLMVLPIGYIIAARLWRGHSAERPLAVVSHLCTAVIMLGTILSVGSLWDDYFLRPVQDRVVNLWLGITFAEATVFYALAGYFRRKSWNAYYGTLAACAAIWQFMGYFGIDSLWHTPIFAAAGVAMILGGRALGVGHQDRYDSSGEQFKAIRGRGEVLFRCGNSVLTIALVITVLRGLGELFRDHLEWPYVVMMLSLTGVSLAASTILSFGSWKRWYTATTIALAALDLQLLNELIDLTGWQKFEIFSVMTGLLILVVSHIGKFNEEEHNEESVSMGLWIGSLLAVGPLFIAMLHYRFFGNAPSLYDELSLLTVTIIMVVLGCSWQIKSTTLIGGSSLFLYLVLLIGSIAYRPEVAIGVYLLAGGAVVFSCGLALSLYRDRLLKLPEQIANREGIFRVISWR